MKYLFSVSFSLFSACLITIAAAHSLQVNDPFSFAFDSIKPTEEIATKDATLLFSFDSSPSPAALGETGTFPVLNISSTQAPQQTEEIAQTFLHAFQAEIAPALPIVEPEPELLAQATPQGGPAPAAAPGTPPSGA